ncbi:hypothetical protein [Leifsonia poae]|uniref:DUF998 domain-containing protein n=1 Tax=Leifsonia poae TaxID=110933 RepID=A0A9W6LYN9_9MICO|nr:hypothetical protein [Leifsonia poae]GLJ74804.1 hypothetical protein GCM10017584_03770 [Leifsonia poae]
MKSLGRALTLALLSAITAEFLLGDQWLSGAAPLGQQIAELVLYTAFYGSAAVLIREIARGTGRGWPSILLLAFAFGVIEEGFVDQSLFNPDFAGEHLLAYGFIPGLAIGGPWTIFVLTLHVIWSMGAPIAIAEALFPRPLVGRRVVAPQVQGRWLGVPGIVVACILYVVGGTAILFATVIGPGFAGTPWQYLTAAVVAAAAIVVALRLPRMRPRGRGPYWWSLLTGLVATSLFVGADRLPRDFSPWLGCLVLLLPLAAGAVLAAVLRLDVLGLATGAVLTYCWLGLVKALLLGVLPAIEQCVLVAAVIAVLIVAYRMRRHVGAPVRVPAL